MRVTKGHSMLVFRSIADMPSNFMYVISCVSVILPEVPGCCNLPRALIWALSFKTSVVLHSSAATRWLAGEMLVRNPCRFCKRCLKKSGTSPKIIAFLIEIFKGSWAVPLRSWPYIL